MKRQYLGARQKLIQTVSALAKGPEDMRGRLPRVYPILADLSVTDFPKVLREDFQWIMGKLTAKEPRYSGPDFWETPAQAGVAAMKTKTAVKIAERIVHISERLRDIITGD